MPRNAAHCPSPVPPVLEAAGKSRKAGGSCLMTCSTSPASDSDVLMNLFDLSTFSLETRLREKNALGCVVSSLKGDVSCRFKARRW